MQRRASGDWPERVMGRDADRHGFCHGCDFLGFAEATTVAEGGLDDANGAVRQSSWNSARSTSRSPVAIGTLVRSATAGQAPVSPGGSGSPTNMGRLGAGFDVGQGRDLVREAPVKIDHHIDAGAKGGSERFDHPGDLVHLGQWREIAGVGVEHRLEGAIALLHDLAGALEKECDSIVSYTPFMSPSPRWVKTWTSSRTLPPSRRQTGAMRCLPTMSYSAISMPGRALTPISIGVRSSIYPTTARIVDSSVASCRGTARPRPSRL